MTWRLARRQSYLKSSVEEAKKAGNDSSFMDIIKQFPIIYNRASTVQYRFERLDYKGQRLVKDFRVA